MKLYTEVKGRKVAVYGIDLEDFYQQKKVGSILFRVLCGVATVAKECKQHKHNIKRKKLQLLANGELSLQKDHEKKEGRRCYFIFKLLSM